MRLLHAADSHLGLRQYTRTTSRGLNQREVDVNDTFARAITAMIALSPDAIVFGGDVLHTPRPSNHSLQHALAQFARLTKALPSTIVLVISGNHDEPKSGDTSCVLPILEHVGVRVVSGHAMRVSYADRDLSVLCVPDVPGINRPELRPDGNERWQVLLMHGEVAGVTQGGADHRTNLGEVSREELGADAFDLVCCGHFHVAEQVAPNVFYSGSLDYCSSNNWAEIDHEKGFYLHDLATGEHAFHAVAPARPFYDLERIVAQGMTPAEIDAAIAERVASVAIDGAVVRLIVDGVERDVEKGLDQKALRSYRARAVHYHLDCRRPVEAIDTIREVTTVRKRELESLTSRVTRQFSAREVPADVDRDALVSTALDYMAQADEVSAECARTLERQLTQSIDQNLLKRSA